MAERISAHELQPGDIYVLDSGKIGSGPKKVLSIRRYTDRASFVVVDYETVGLWGHGTASLRRGIPVLRLSYIEPLGVLDLIQRSTTPSHLTIFNTREGFYA